MTIARVRAVLGIDKYKIGGVLTRAWAMYNGMDADKVTYAAASPDLPGFLVLIQSLTSAHQLVTARTRGAAAARDVQRDLLITGMESERMYVQTLADASGSPSRGVSLIQNAGLLVAASPAHTRALLTLRLGKQPGTVICDANAGLLVGVGTPHPMQRRFFNWAYTLDGTTFASAGSTSRCKTTLQNLPLLTVVGVRVSLTNGTGPGPWSQVVTILVH
jgi:hypothetical protein